MYPMQYRWTINIQQVHYCHNNTSLSALCCRILRRVKMLLEASLLDDLRALVEFAQSGAIAGAAACSHRARACRGRRLSNLFRRWLRNTPRSDYGGRANLPLSFVCGADAKTPGLLHCREHAVLQQFFG